MGRLLVLFLSLLCSLIFQNNARAASDCNDPGIALPKLEWCDFFKRSAYVDQDDHNRRVDPAVKASMNVPTAPDKSVRSYAFVISIWDYNFPGSNAGELLAIKNEQVDIINFLKEQGFDEAAVLQNREATPAVIRSLFTEYFIPKIYSDFSQGRKVRFMFIFDGHGWRPNTEEAPGALALSDLTGEGDPIYAHRFSLAELRALLQDLSPYTQSVIALLGSCYGGSVLAEKPFGDAPYNGPSAWIAAATPGWSEAWISPNKKGTIFLQALMNAVRKWQPQLNLPEGDNAAPVDIGALTPRLSDLIHGINDQHFAGENPDTHKPYPPIVIDTVSFMGNRNGAYRFVGAKQLSPQLASLTDVTFTGSAVVGRPDIQVVLTPEQYKIVGVDISHHDRAIDFPKLKAAGVRFVYAKATQGAVAKDPQFGAFSKSAVAAGIDVGAYHFFDFCAPAARQFQNIRAGVPRDQKLLPLAIDVEWNIVGPTVERKPTDCGSITNLRAQLLALLSQVEDYYGIRPIIYTATAFNRAYQLFDVSFQKYPVWLADLSNKAKGANGPSNLAGNPWTIWQSAIVELQGYPGQKFDKNFFFGNEQDYQAFRAGKTNVALEAAQGKTASPKPN
jgi:GH25 family lysozyme M1 (1,4-beta-N-acetylmuramidase)